MELPIQIMIVLFVTILVGSTVIMFSTDILRNAKDKLNQPENEKAADNNVIEIDTINDNSIKMLSKECFDRNKQEALAKTLCFIVHGKSNSMTIPIGSSTLEGVPVTTSYNAATDKTIFLYYNPAGNLVEIIS